MNADTIFAVASGAGHAAIAVMRLSGPASRTIVAALCGRVPAPRRASFRRLRNVVGEELDRGMVVWLPGPGSYTGEDFGGILPARRTRGAGGRGGRAGGSWRPAGRAGRIHPARLSQRPHGPDRGGGGTRPRRRGNRGAATSGAAPAGWRTGSALWRLGGTAARAAGAAGGTDRLPGRGPAARGRGAGAGRARGAARRGDAAPGRWPSWRATARRSGVRRRRPPERRQVVAGERARRTGCGDRLGDPGHDARRAGDAGGVGRRAGHAGGHRRPARRGRCDRGRRRPARPRPRRGGRSGDRGAGSRGGRA